MAVKLVRGASSFFLPVAMPSCQRNPRTSSGCYSFYVRQLSHRVNNYIRPRRVSGPPPSQFYRLICRRVICVALAIDIRGLFDNRVALRRGWRRRKRARGGIIATAMSRIIGTSGEPAIVFPRYRAHVVTHHASAYTRACVRG